MSQNSNELNKVLCTCSKCCKKDTENGIGRLIPKSTRTRHRKKEHENQLEHSLSFSSSSELVSNLSLSDVDSSLAESEIFQPVKFLSRDEWTSDFNMKDNVTSDFNMKDNETLDSDIEDDWTDFNIEDDWISDFNIEDDWTSDSLIDELSDSRNISGKKLYY